MRSFELNKLVRDGIVPSMEAAEQTVVSRRLDDAEFVREAGRKVLEEAKEFDPEKPDIAEVIDIIQAAEAVAAGLGISSFELERLKAVRKAERGVFTERMFVETVTLADNDPWAEYYAKEPERFREIK